MPNDISEHVLAFGPRGLYSTLAQKQQRTHVMRDERIYSMRFNDICEHGHALTHEAYLYLDSVKALG